MRYEPKILINRTGKKVEFMCGGEIYIFEVGEKRLLDGFVAYHALKNVNTGLEEYVEKVEEVEEKVGEEKPDYASMKWAELKKLAKGKGYKVGMKRKEVVALLENV